MQNNHTCTKCHESKPVDMFYKCSANKNNDGLMHWCKACTDKFNREYIEKNPVELFARQTIKVHKYRGCDVTNLIDNFDKFVDVIRNAKHCACCGSKLRYEYGFGYNEPMIHRPTVDRIDNTDRTMTLDNIQVICKRCNTWKGKHTQEDYNVMLVLSEKGLKQCSSCGKIAVTTEFVNPNKGPSCRCNDCRKKFAKEFWKTYKRPSRAKKQK